MGPKVGLTTAKHSLSHQPCAGVNAPAPQSTIMGRPPGTTYRSCSHAAFPVSEALSRTFQSVSTRLTREMPRGGSEGSPQPPPVRVRTALRPLARGAPEQAVLLGFRLCGTRRLGRASTRRILRASIIGWIISATRYGWRNQAQLASPADRREIARDKNEMRAARLRV